MPNYIVKHKGKESTVEFNYLPEVTEQLDLLKNSGLSMCDIYRITLWKVGRYPQMDNGVLEELNSLKSANKLDKAKTKDVLKSLLNINGIGLPMASSYLRFLNPLVYQIIDARAFRAAYFYRGDCLNKNNNFISLTTGTIENRINIYIGYLEQLHKIANEGYNELMVKFEDLDRFLYDLDKASGFQVSDKKSSIECLKKWNKIIEGYKSNK